MLTIDKEKMYRRKLDDLGKRYDALRDRCMKLELGPIQRIASVMAKKHPNSKSGERAVVRALAAAVEDEGGDAADTLRRITLAHTAWCQTADWDESQGKYVQALAAWIRNGGWRKMPPEKKKTPPPKGDEMSFDASL